MHTLHCNLAVKQCKLVSGPSANQGFDPAHLQSASFSESHATSAAVLSSVQNKNTFHPASRAAFLRLGQPGIILGFSLN